MPMYEYGCAACQEQFSLLRRMDQADTTIQCPACGSDQVHRHFSVFAAHSKGGEHIPLEPQSFGGGCGNPGGCGCGTKH